MTKQSTAIGVPGICRAYGCNPSYIYKLILCGQIEAKRDELGRWAVDRKSFEQWNARRLQHPRNRERARAPAAKSEPTHAAA